MVLLSQALATSSTIHDLLLPGASESPDTCAHLRQVALLLQFCDPLTIFPFPSFLLLLAIVGFGCWYQRALT